MVSIYLFLGNQIQNFHKPTKTMLLISELSTFEDFVQFLLDIDIDEDIMTMSQMNWFDNPDYIIKFETLKLDFESFCQKKNISCELEHWTENKFNGRLHYEDYYKYNWMIDTIKYKYNKEISYFGFTDPILR